MRACCLFVVVLVLLGFSLFPHSTVKAQTNLVTIYGQLGISQQCSTGGGCANMFSLATNGTTPGIPDNLTLDFSQSVTAAPAQSDDGMHIAATGHYGQGLSCPVASGCYVFFVHVWSPHYPPPNPPPGTGCWTSPNYGTTWYSVQCVQAPNVPLAGLSRTPSGSTDSILVIIIAIAVAYLFFRTRKK